MKDTSRIERLTEQLRGLAPGVTQRMCDSFADLFWDKVDVLRLVPGVLLETESRVLVVQEMNGELRYYAGGWGSEHNRVTELNELGTFEYPEDVLPFAEQFLIKRIPLQLINTRRDRKGGTALA